MFFSFLGFVLSAHVCGLDGARVMCLWCLRVSRREPCASEGPGLSHRCQTEEGKKRAGSARWKNRPAQVVTKRKDRRDVISHMHMSAFLHKRVEAVGRSDVSDASFLNSGCNQRLTSGPERVIRSSQR